MTNKQQPLPIQKKYTEYYESKFGSDDLKEALELELRDFRFLVYMKNYLTLYLYMYVYAG